MTKEELRLECSRLIECNTIKDSIDLIDVYSGYLFNVITKHQPDPVSSKADAEAKLINQMMFTKVLCLRKIILGIDYIGTDGTRLNHIIDPTILASFIRNIYELVSMFNLIYINPVSKDERLILYNLWVISGLKYRQKFIPIISTLAGKEKLESEQTQIAELIKQIELTDLYKSLDESEKKKIQQKIKEKDYKVKFEGKSLFFYNWQELTKIIGIKDGLLDHIYTYFSLYSHPSNVSVFQFADMFKKGDEAFRELTQANLNDLFMLLSIFIADYIKLFPRVIDIFNQLSYRDQIVINFRNTLMRGYDYSINNSWESVN